MTTAAPSALIDVYFVLLPQTLLLDVAGPAEALRLANQQRMRQGLEPAFALHFVGPQAQAVSSVGLMMAGLAPLPERIAPSSWVVLSGQMGDRLRSGEAFTCPNWLQTRHWLSQTVAPQLGKSDARLVTICSGTLLAADAGLIGKRACTSHHRLLDALQRLAPQAQVQRNRVLVVDGPLASSAGVTAGIDLTLHLIALHSGPRLAGAVAQEMAVYLRRGPQDPELSPLLQHRHHLHEALHRVQDAITQDPTQPWSAQAMAEVAHTTPRHLSRLFAQHTHTTPQRYLSSLRLERAKQLLAQGAPMPTVLATSGFDSA